MPPDDPAPFDPQAPAPIVVQQSDPGHIPQWAVKGLLALLALVFIPGSIAVISYVFGGIHSRLSENEKAIQALKEDRAVINARLDRNDEADRRQWQLMSENKEKIAEHRHN